jgi:hypothetical protein
MAESKYAVTNMLRKDYEPFRKYCKNNDILIVRALAEATKMWLDKKLKQEQDKPI